MLFYRQQNYIKQALELKSEVRFFRLTFAMKLLKKV